MINGVGGSEIQISSSFPPTEGSNDKNSSGGGGYTLYYCVANLTANESGAHYRERSFTCVWRRSKKKKKKNEHSTECIFWSLIFSTVLLHGYSVDMFMYCSEAPTRATNNAAKRMFTFMYTYGSQENAALRSNHQ